MKLRLRLAILGCLWLLASFSTADAQLLPRGGAVPASGDAIATLVASTPHNTWKRTSGAIGAASASALPRTRANFDGYGTGANGFFADDASVEGFVQPGTNFDQHWSFSKQSLDLARYKVLGGFSGGHAAGGDASVYVDDITADAAAINAGQTPPGWALKRKSGKYIPFSDTEPAWQPQSGPAAGTNFASTTGTWSSGSTSVSVADASNIAVGMFANATGVQQGTKVSAVSGTTITLSLATTASGSATPIKFAAGTGGWMTLNADGLEMLCAAHVYDTIHYLGSGLWSIGGYVCKDSGASSHIGGAGFYNDVTDTLTIYASAFTGFGDAAVTLAGGAVGPTMICPSNGKLYTWGKNGSFVDALYEWQPPYPATADPTVIASNGSILANGYLEGVCLTQPGATGKEMIFQHTSSAGSGAFSVITDIHGTPAFTTGTYTNASVPFTGSDSARSWAIGPAGLIAYESDGHIYQITFASPTSATISDIGCTLGDVPNYNPDPRYGNQEWPRIAYDSTHGVYWVVITQDVYFCRP